MKQADRQLTTLIIWSVFFILVLFTYDRLMYIPADLTGLWPQMAPVFPQAEDAETLSQIIAAAREASPAILDHVQATIREQMALRVPLATAMTAMYALAATLCTWFIWRNAGVEAYLAREAVQAEKAKRRSRIEQFMEDLDADELDQLRARLADEEGLELRH
ncbi:MAG: hypothetical protein CL610_29085 [Anaerolineaceae bacterium]|nr:hypothetical protein [Anaerolineaceae bacterium]